METSGASTDPLLRLKNLMTAQARVESNNFAPTSLAMRQKNPLNLKFANQPNAVISDSGFCKFDTLENGYKAAMNQLRIVCNGTSKAYTAEAKKLGLKNSSYLTLRKYIYIFASSSTEIEKDNYVKRVCKELNLPEITPMSYFL